jgi:hypothetical protein
VTPSWQTAEQETGWLSFMLLQKMAGWPCSRRSIDEARSVTAIPNISHWTQWLLLQCATSLYAVRQTSKKTRSEGRFDFVAS